MRKKLKLLIFSCACIGAAGAGTISSAAAMNLETDAPVAGVSVAINNYYASSLHPEEELAAAFTGGEGFRVSSGEPEAEAGERAGEIPTVMASSKNSYDNVAISRVSNYVNVRAEANTTSSVVGKIYNNCAATILSTVDGEGGKWYQIQSGNVKGYIKAQYFITGAEAEKIARQVGTSYARVANTSTLRLREEPSLESKTLDLLSPEAEYEVIGEEGDFAKIAVDTDLVGYVFKDYINIRVEFQQAVTQEEEEAKAANEAQLKKEAEDAIRQLEETKKQVESQKASESAEASTENEAPTEQAAPGAGVAPEADPAAGTEKAPGGVPEGAIEANPAGGSTAAAQLPETTAPETTAASKETVKAPGSSSSSSGGPGSSSGSTAVESATRTAIVAYAKQFLGNPYVYGGTSLTNGADCSGFTQAIYAHFGITTGRSSRDQAAKGKEISVSSVQPGDLLFYASGNYINHVAMYIGNGQVIHASNSKTGITISPFNYRTPCKAVTFLN